ncbi:MAG: phosphatidyl-myo-inositol dimannoside synthase, partial [Actinomycetota bacterium]|nr:phosphatidyl-myo-inositol dimannoside synthase [Actinomycetota bacterium]
MSDQSAPGHTLVVTNDFPPRAGGIQAFVQGLVSRQPPESITVYAPKWARCEEFDAEQSFEVVRHPTSLMVPEPMVIRRATALVHSRGATRVLFGAAAPLGLIAGPLRKAGAHTIVALTHGHEAGWAMLP